MSGYARSQRPRQAILGQLPRINRADGSPIRVLLVDDEPALTNLVKMALHYEGWDVEITFRRLAHRVRALAARSAGILLCATVCLASGLAAQEPAQERSKDRDPKQLVQGVLEGPEFNEKRVTGRWRYRAGTEESGMARSSESSPTARVRPSRLRTTSECTC